MYRPQSHQLTALTLFLLIAGGYFIMATWFPVAYIWGTYEDLFGEWGQTYFFATACVISLLVAKSDSQYRWFFIVLALALLYTVLEEISWGQRIFGFDSPEFFKRHNLQRETNLHNILVGPFSTNTKAVIEFVMAIALTLYGVVYPLVLRLGWKLADWLHRLGVAAPPLYLWPFFLAASMLEFGWFNFNEAEVAELLVGYALSIMAIHYLLAQRYQLSVHAQIPWEEPASKSLSIAITGIFLTVAMLSGLTTWAMYSDPVKRERMDARLLNGYEKFAKRYSRYDRFDVTADLYLRVHQAEPKRTSILRRLAKTYRTLGDEEQFRFYTGKALDVLLAKYEKNQDKASTNLALARTYRQLGETEKAQQHGQRAHELVLDRAQKNPESAHWAYWLGKTHRHLGNLQAATEQYEKAFRLKPTSSKYRKAYYSIRRETGQQ